MNNKGFSLAEVLVSLPLILVTLSIILGTYITMQKLFPGSITQVALQSYGRSALGRIANNIRQSTDASINGNGDILTITLDPNLTYNNQSDDITAQYAVSAGSIVYDPDTSTPGDDSILLENVTTETGIPYFQKNQDMIVVTFRVTKTNALFGTQNSSLSTTIKVRSDDG